MTMFEVAAVLSPIASMAFAYFAFRRNQKSDDGQTAREMGTILTEIGYIKSSIDGVNRKLEHTDERYTQLVERISSVEASVKSAHHRLDTFHKGGAAKDE